MVLWQDVHSQGEVIACLEKGLVTEAEQQAGQQVGQPLVNTGIKDECKKAIMRVAELSSDDFHLDRHLYFACRDDRERFCENVGSLSALASRCSGGGCVNLVATVKCISYFYLMWFVMFYLGLNQLLHHLSFPPMTHLIPHFVPHTSFSSCTDPRSIL